MSDFGGKNVQNSISAGAAPQTLYGEAYKLQRSSFWPLAAFKGPYF